jgi:hypothetical protein
LFITVDAFRGTTSNKQIDQQLSVGLKVGDTVTITPEYLNSSIDVIEHQFVLIAAELWKKLEPEDSERCPLLLNLGVRCLEESRWTTARGFSYFVMNDGNETEANRLKGRINYWQSFKWPGEYESIRDEVEKYDFSAKGEIFQIACAAVKSDFDALFKLLPRAIESGALSKSNLWSWPLFRELRAQARFAAYAPDSEPGPPASPASPPSDQTQTT